MRFGIPVIFFIVFFVFLLIYINPTAIYSSNGLNIHNYVSTMHVQEKSSQHAVSYMDPSFRRQFILELTPGYLHDIISTPGGLSRFAVTLCIYACHNPIIGAIVLTLLALFFYWIFLLYIHGIGARQLYVAGFIPSFFLLIICAWYELSDCIFLLTAAGALVFAVLYQRLRPTRTVTRILWQSLLFLSGWYFMQWGSLLFILFIVIHELFNNERRSSSVVIAAINVALLYAVDSWFIPINKTIHWSNFTELSGLPLVLIFSFPLVAILLRIFRCYRRVQSATITTISVIVQISLLIGCVLALTLWLLREPVNRDTRTVARTLDHIMNGKWEAILHENTATLFVDFPQKDGPLQEFMMHSVNHALCLTGRIGDNLCNFPQKLFSEDPMLIFEITQTRGYVNWVMAMDLAMDLGMVSLAEKLTGEIMENVGPYPDFIYRRALIQIAKGNKQAAAVYLNKLVCMPFYKTEAKRLLGIIYNDSAIMAEPRIALMHANMDTTDHILFTISYENTLKKLLQSNPGNKIAFDYLMTYYLISGRLDGVAELAPRASTVGYTMLPCCWEQALCIYQAMNSLWGTSSGVPFPEIRQTTTSYFNEFTSAYDKLADDPSASLKLVPRFGDSYFYFSMFRFSPGVRHE